MLEEVDNKMVSKENYVSTVPVMEKPFKQNLSLVINRQGNLCVVKPMAKYLKSNFKRPKTIPKNF